MKRIEKTVFVTEDGKEFLTEVEAHKHEAKLNRAKAYRILYQPDLNETGRLTKTGYLIVESNYNHSLWANDWCFKEFGSQVAFVQGVSPTQNWSLSSIELEKVEEHLIIGRLSKH